MVEPGINPNGLSLLKNFFSQEFPLILILILELDKLKSVGINAHKFQSDAIKKIQDTCINLNYEAKSLALDGQEQI